MADNKKQRTPEEMEKALAAANEALAQAKKEAEDAKEAAKAAEAVMRGMAAGEASDDGMVPFWAFKDDGRYKDDMWWVGTARCTASSAVSTSAFPARCTTSSAARWRRTRRRRRCWSRRAGNMRRSRRS